MTHQESGRHCQFPGVVLLHPRDNVLISIANLPAQAEFEFEGIGYRLSQAAPIGHKIARYDLAAGEKILRYGVPIGSLFKAVRAGDWVHIHNLKSDYLASHTRTGQVDGDSDG